LDLVTKFHNAINFGTSDTILAQRFLGIQKNIVSLISNDSAYAMTFSTYLLMNLAISGLSSAQPIWKETKQLATKNMVAYPLIAKRF